jgi:thiaminase
MVDQSQKEFEEALDEQAIEALKGINDLLMDLIERVDHKNFMAVWLACYWMLEDVVQNFMHDDEMRKTRAC